MSFYVGYSLFFTFFCGQGNLVVAGVQLVALLNFIRIYSFFKVKNSNAIQTCAFLFVDACSLRSSRCSGKELEYFIQPTGLAQIHHLRRLEAWSLLFGSDCRSTNSLSFCINCQQHKHTNTAEGSHSHALSIMSSRLFKSGAAHLDRLASATSQVHPHHHQRAAFKQASDTNAYNFSTELASASCWSPDYIATLGLPGEIAAQAFDPVQSLLVVGTKSGSLHLFGQGPVKLEWAPRPAFAIKLLAFKPGTAFLFVIGALSKQEGSKGEHDAKNGIFCRRERYVDRV